MTNNKRRGGNGFLSFIGALALTILAIPLCFYLTVYLLARRSGKLPARIQNWIGSYYYPTYLSPEHIARVPNFVRSLEPNARILNVGGGIQNYATNVVNIDIVPTHTTTVAADAHRLPFRDESFDAVVSIAVFEHLERPWIATDEIYRILKPGGACYMEVPFLQPFHADPGDYYRYTIPGLRSIFRDFEEREVGVANGPGSMLTWILTEFAGIVADIDGSFDDTTKHVAPNRFLRAKEAGRLLFAPLKYLDKWLQRKEHSFVVASGVYYQGVKPLTRKGHSA